MTLTFEQSKLELSMKSEFKENLGNVNFMVTYRDNAIIINIPSGNNKFHILISSERISNPQEIVKDLTNLFKQMENEIRSPDG